MPSKRKKNKHNVQTTTKEQTKKQSTVVFKITIIIIVVVFIIVVCVLRVIFGRKEEEQVCPAQQPSTDECRLYMTESTIPNSGWGIFTTVDLSRSSPVGYPDMVLHLSDPILSSRERVWLNYMWNGQDVGGSYEGIHVYSVPPGIGMLANGGHNVRHLGPTNSDTNMDGDPRVPTRGSMSTFHGFSFVTSQPIPAGGELLVQYGSNWFQNRPQITGQQQHQQNSNRPVSWLRLNGWCLDHIQAKPSNIGHGAFATRFLAKDTMIAPAPLLPLSQSSLQLIRQSNNHDIHYGKQLLLNYCFGHSKSSLLLFPYSPIVNYINHSSDKEKINAKLRWSSHQKYTWPSLEELYQKEDYGVLVLEFIATRDIVPGEEIFINYGPIWEQAWNQHVSTWVPPQTNNIPSTTMNQTELIIKTIHEQKRSNPYPDNLFTSCYYSYNNNQNHHSNSNNPNSGGYKRWKLTKEILQYRNLRPCIILERHNDNGYYYTVEIKNRYNLLPNERIPKENQPYIVTHVPRYAITFSDKLYTTDTYLPNVFRHYIPLPDDLFPTQWMDLENDNNIDK